MTGGPLPPLRGGKAQEEEVWCPQQGRVLGKRNNRFPTPVGVFLFVSFTSWMTNKTHRGASV